MTQQEMLPDCATNRSPASARPRPHQRASARGGKGMGRSRDTPGKQVQGKRVTFPWINGQIIAAADTEDLHHLLLTVNTHLEQMNLVNLSTALHRIAKLSGGYHGHHHQALLQQTLPPLLGAVRQALIKSEETGATPKCQALSNITWSLATMQVVDLPLLQMLLPRAYSQLHDFKNFELCQLLWAFAKLGTVNSVLCDFSAPLFTAAAQFVIRHIEDFSFRGLVMTSWAFATAKQSDPRLFRAIAHKLLPAVSTANCQELANTAWSFSTAGVYQEGLFELMATVSIPRVLEFKPQELSSILWSFASIGCSSDKSPIFDDFYEAAGRAATQMELQAQQLANILWALTKMRPHHHSTREVVLRLLPWCTALIRTFKTQELASVALAASKSFGTTPGSEEIFQPVPLQVVQFFRAALPMAVPNLRDYSGQSLANITSSFLAVQAGTPDLFAGVSYEVMSRAESLENSALLLLLKSLPQVPRSTPVDSALCQLFAEAARRVDSLSVRELQAVARICVKPFAAREDSKSTVPTVTRESREELRAWLLTLATKWGSADFWPSEAGSEGMKKADVEAEEEEEEGNAAIDRWVPPITLTVANTGRPASAWDEQAMQQLRDSMEDAAAQREEKAKDQTDGVGEEQPAQQQPHFVFSVKNTFLDVEEGSDAEGSDSELMQMPLPPALPFIPDSVSAEKLQAYRANYARFRVGNAIGAKGELDTVS